MKNIINILKDKDLQKLLAGAAIMLTGTVIMARSSSKIDQKYGAEVLIQTAEKMQPGFRDALKAFIKTEYGLQ